VADVKRSIETAQGADVYPAAQQMLIHQGKVLKDGTTLEENKVAENSFVVIMLSKVKREGRSLGKFEVVTERNKVFWRRGSSMELVGPTHVGEDVLDSRHPKPRKFLSLPLLEREILLRWSFFSAEKKLVVVPKFIAQTGAADYHSLFDLGEMSHSWADWFSNKEGLDDNEHSLLLNRMVWSLKKLDIRKGFFRVDEGKYHEFLKVLGPCFGAEEKSKSSPGEGSAASTAPTSKAPQTSAPPPASTPAPQAPVVALPPPPAPSPAPAAAPISSVTAASEPDVYGNAASNLVAGNNLEGAIQQILDMGGGTWDRDTVLRALRAAFNNPERAVEYLYSGIPEQAEAPPVARPPPSGPAENPPAQQAQPAAVPSTGPNANPLDLFPQVPSFGLLLSKILLPKQNILGQLAAAMPQSVTVTPEEREAIERLEAMGFDRAIVLEVFFACNKNEELAANYLLDHMHEFED
ncbi:hypothetical protein RJ639_025467, partial [Escallonia herrerae]